MERLQVGARFGRWWFVLPLVLSLVGVVVAALTALGDVDTGLVFACLTVPFAVWTIAAGAAVAMRRRWLEIGPSSFTVGDARGVREIRDDQVVRLAADLRRNYSAGLYTSTSRRYRLWTAGDAGEQVVEFGDVRKGEGHDPLGALIGRLSDALHRRAKDAVAAGRPLEGTGWSLQRDALRIARGHDFDLLRGEQIGAVGVFDGALCVWRRGEEEPAFRLPVNEPDAGLLERLLREMAPGEREAAAPAGDGLGRVLFERRPSAGAKGMLWILGAAGVVGAGVLVLNGEWIWGAGVLVVAGLCGWWGWELGYSAFRCHELGVCQHSRTKQTRIRYGDVATFTYSAVRQFVNGAYTGTAFNFAFHPRADLGVKPITYMASLQGADEELDNLRDHVAQVIAARMAGELSEGRPVDWTPKLRILPGAFEYRPKGFFGGSKESRAIPFDQVANFELQQGVFHLWVKGEKNSVVQEDVAAPNFFPGFYLVHHLFSAKS